MINAPLKNMRSSNMAQTTDYTSDAGARRLCRLIAYLSIISEAADICPDLVDEADATSYADFA